MKTLLMCALLLAPLAAQAAKKAAAKPKPASMDAVVKVSANNGVTWTVDEVRAKNLGYEQAPVTKEYVLDGENDPTQHAVMVTFKSDGTSPRDLMISSTSALGFVDGQPSEIDGYTFRMDLSGKLIAGLRASGKVESVMQQKLDIKSGDTKNRFKTILSAICNHRAIREKMK